MGHRTRERGAAEYLNVSPETLSKWRQRGEGPPCFKIGGVIVYDLDEIDVWLEEYCRKIPVAQRTDDPLFTPELIA